MKTKAGGTKGFRPTGKTLEMIETAEKLGLNIAELLRAVVDKYGPNVFDPAIKAKKQELQKLIASLS